MAAVRGPCLDLALDIPAESENIMAQPGRHVVRLFGHFTRWPCLRASNLTISSFRAPWEDYFEGGNQLYISWTWYRGTIWKCLAQRPTGGCLTICGGVEIKEPVVQFIEDYLFDPRSMGSFIRAVYSAFAPAAG